MRSRSATALRWRLAVGATVLMSLVPGCSPAPEAPPPPTTSSPSSSLTAAAERALTMGVREGQNGALKPWWTGSAVQAEIPAGVTPHDKYRSEFFWNSPAGPQIKLGEGDRIRCRLHIGPHLGSTAADRGVWQVVWQLHGPQKDTTWPPPPLNLHVRGGSWRIGGGAGRPDGYAAYAKPFSTYVDGANVTWDLDVLISQDPKKARVDAWLDGRHVVKDWHPPSGTRYPTHAWLTMKSGLYTGSDPGTKPPTQRRYVTFAPMECAITKAASTTTSSKTAPQGPSEATAGPGSTS